MVKCMPTMQETQFRFLGREDPLEKEMATHSSILAWKIPWTEELGWLLSMGSQSWTRLSEFTITIYPPLNQGWANCGPWVCQLFCDPGGGFRQVLLEHSYAYLFTLFYDCFLGAIAEPNSCDRGYVACKDSSTYPVASCREGMLTPVPDHPSLPQRLSGPHWLTTLSFPRFCVPPGSCLNVTKTHAKTKNILH